jgi:hypothetical protein
VADSCDHSDKLWGSKKWGELLDNPSVYHVPHPGNYCYGSLGVTMWKETFTDYMKFVMLLSTFFARMEC